MATIMEKEVLIEVVASSLALISRKSNYQEYLNHNEDCNRLIEIRNYLPDFWANIGTGTTGEKGGFDWGERTEADKHRELVEHIRIQNMNEERNRR